MTDQVGKGKDKEDKITMNNSNLTSIELYNLDRKCNLAKTASCPQIYSSPFPLKTELRVFLRFPRIKIHFSSSLWL